MVTNSAITCLNFSEQELHIVTVDVVKHDLITEYSIKYNFEALNTDGAVINPSKVGKFILDTVNQYHLSPKIRIGINLKYLDIKSIYLPQMPENELVQVITDEAIRESVFSFSNKNISVAYKVTGNRNGPTGITELEIITATIPSEVIDSYLAIFQSSGLKLLSIQPLIEGLQEIVDHRFSSQRESFAFVKLAANEGEFYIWSQNALQFWRSLPAGFQDPERLQLELDNSLEHYQRKTNQKAVLKTLYLFGESLPQLEVDFNFPLEYLFKEKKLDLIGLGFNQKEKLSFITSPENSKFEMGKEIKLLLFIASLVFFLTTNVWFGWQLWDKWQDLSFVKKQQVMLESNLASYEKDNLSIDNQQNTPSNIDCDLLFEELRTITPSDMRFEKLLFNADDNSILLEGISLESQSLSSFVARVTEMSQVKSAIVLNSAQPPESPVHGYYFSLKIELGVK